MAEVAAGLWAAEEVVSTSLQAGVAAYMVAKPTLPLKATLTRIATSTDDSTKLSLCRSGHTVTLIDDRAYIFGGLTASGALAGIDVHVITILAAPESQGPLYTILPPASFDNAESAPAARTQHAACAMSNICIAIYGGMTQHKVLVQDDCDFWLFNVEKGTWQAMRAAAEQSHPEPRSGATLMHHNDNLYLIGGNDAAGQVKRDCWTFALVARIWTRLADVPTPCHNFALADGKLYAVSTSDAIGAQMHVLDCESTPSSTQVSWTTLEFPAHPIAPGPCGRVGSGLVPIFTGHGRQYLLYFFGEKHVVSQGIVQEDHCMLSDMWAFQLPSKTSVLRPTTHVGDIVQGAEVKDGIRGVMGLETHRHKWEEIDILPPKALDESEGKLHPGPRAYSAYATLSSGTRVFFWGGLNPKGEMEGDGWLIDIV